MIEEKNFSDIKFTISEDGTYKIVVPQGFPGSESSKEIRWVKYLPKPNLGGIQFS